MSVARAVGQGKRLWALHLMGNAALVAAFYQWLWIPDGTGAELALTAVIGLAIAALALWLHGGALVYFRMAHRSGGEASLPAAFRAAARHLPALAIAAVIILAVTWLILQLMVYRDPVSNWIASWLTFGFRRPIAPSSVAWVYGWLVWLAAFVKWPLMLLPWVESAASNGLAAFRWENLKRPARTTLRPRYWLQCFGVFVFGVIIPCLLVNWTPPVSGIPAETVSLSVRFLIAYLVAVTAWLFMVSNVSAWSARATEDGRR